MTASPRHSFVVIAFNEAANIATTIDAILAQEGLADHEVIIVDDGSTDATAAIVEGYATQHTSVRLHRMGDNQGRGAARAAGAQQATGEFIAFVDADIELPRNWLRECSRHLDGFDAVGGIAVPDGDVAFVHRWFGLTPRPVPQTTTITGNNGLYRREVFDRVSFEQDLKEGEDVALNHAMDERNLRIRMIDDLVARHNETKTFAESIRWLYQSGRGASRQLRRYRRVRPPDLAFGGFAAATTVAYLSARRGRRSAAVLVPGYLTVVSILHLQRRFELAGGRRGGFPAAVLANGALILAYFIGRIRGLGAA